MSHHKGEDLKMACQAAIEAIKKLKDPSLDDIQSKLEFCIGSYEFDNNPVGLYEFGRIALQHLTEVRNTNARKVAKKTLTDLESALHD